MKVYLSGGRSSAPFQSSSYKNMPIHCKQKLEVKFVACGMGHIVIVTDCNEVWTFGRNSHGQCGLGHTEDVPCFTQVPLPFMNNNNNNTSIKLLTCGPHRTAIVTSNNQIYACGASIYGGLGKSDRLVFTRIPFNSKTLLQKLFHLIDYHKNNNNNNNIDHIASGNSHFITVKNGNQLYGFGSSSRGQLGMGDYKDRLKRVHRIPLKLKDQSVKQIACGYAHSVVLTDQNKLYATGCNGHGQLAIHKFTAYCSFHQVNLPSEIKSIRSVASGLHHTTILSDSGKLYGCGLNQYGQLGLYCFVDHIFVTRTAEEIGHRIKSINLSNSMSSLIETEEGELWGTGHNSFNQLNLPDARDHGKFEKISTRLSRNEYVVNACIGYEYSVIITNHSDFLTRSQLFSHSEKCVLTDVEFVFVQK